MPGGRYPQYVLGVLVVVYVFNFLDRQIISILAERVKADLGLSDAQIGFLYGTAFAVFYAVFGIPLGRLADVWDRRRLIAIGLTVWSCMTALSGLARSFPELAAARIGVGIGEASATPAAFSLLSDYFPPARRATVLAVYSSGIYIGAGVGLGVGGLIVERWDTAWAGTAAPLGLRGWQVAFFAVGLPGLLLALVVRALREPMRGQADGIFTPPEPRPLRAFLRELGAVVPPLTLVNLGLAGWRPVVLNLAAAGAIAALALLVTRALGNPAQWMALGLGLYAATSWAQALRLRDPVAFALIFRTPSLRLAGLAFACLAFSDYAIGFWTPPFFVRMHGVDEAEAGLVLGGMAAAAGWLGATVGGIVADRWRLRNPCGRLHVAMLTATLPLLLAPLVLTIETTTVAYASGFPLIVAQSSWLGVGASTVQDLVLPRMRATASAAFLLLVTFVGLALGPYTVGRLSVALGDLRAGMLLALSANVLALVFALLATRHLARDEATRLERARAAGEAGLWETPPAQRGDGAVPTCGGRRFRSRMPPRAKEDAMQVQTVRGPVDSSRLGVTLMHEHVFVLSTEVQQNYPAIWNEEERVADAVAKLQELKGRGVQTIVDPTVIGLGRYIPRIERIAGRVDLNIIVATGVYTYNDLPFYFHFRGPGTLFDGPEVMIDLFVKDITEGIAGTGVKAAILKCATDAAGLTPGVERILRAVAQAHRRTGVPITTHTHAHTHRGRDQQRVFREEGVDLGRVIIGHSGDTTELDYLKELMDNGSYIGMDRFGIDLFLPFEDRVNTVVALCKQGYAGRMVLSHDASCFMDWLDPEVVRSAAPKWNFTHISDDVLPALRARGVSEAQIDQMLVDNPRRIFEHGGGY